MEVRVRALRLSLSACSGRLLTTYYLLLTTYLEVILVGLQRQATYYLPLTTYYLLLTTYYLPLTTYYLLLTLRLSLSACSGTLDTLSIRRASGRCAW